MRCFIVFCCCFLDLLCVVFFGIGSSCVVWSFDFRLFVELCVFVFFSCIYLLIYQFVYLSICSLCIYLLGYLDY